MTHPSSPAPAAPPGPTLRRVLKSGLVIHCNRSRTASVTVRELTDEGARLHCGQGALIPSEFELLVDFDGLLADCEVIWRTREEIGVRFLSTGPAGSLLKRRSGIPKLPLRPKLRNSPA